jgi:DNA-binding transcriptional regulator LsrR (DeoR family)
VGNINLKIISTIKNSNKFQKTTLWKEKSVEDVVTLGSMAQTIIVTIGI